MSARLRPNVSSTIVVTAMAVSVILAWQLPRDHLQQFRERIIASLRQDSEEWQNVQFFEGDRVVVELGNRYSVSAWPEVCDGNFIAVYVRKLENAGSGEPLCKFLVDQKVIHSDLSRDTGTPISQTARLELEQRARALGIAYLAAMK